MNAVAPNHSGFDHWARYFVIKPVQPFFVWLLPLYAPTPLLSHSFILCLYPRHLFWSADPISRVTLLRPSPGFHGDAPRRLCPQHPRFIPGPVSPESRGRGRGCFPFLPLSLIVIFKRNLYSPLPPPPTLVLSCVRPSISEHINPHLLHLKVNSISSCSSSPASWNPVVSSLMYTQVLCVTSDWWTKKCNHAYCRLLWFFMPSVYWFLNFKYVFRTPVSRTRVSHLWSRRGCNRCEHLPFRTPVINSSLWSVTATSAYALYYSYNIMLQSYSKLEQLHAGPCCIIMNLHGLDYCRVWLETACFTLIEILVHVIKIHSHCTWRIS